MSEQEIPGRIEKVIEGLTPLCIVQGRTEDFMPGVATGVDVFAQVASYWYVSFIAAPGSCAQEEVLLLKYKWLAGAMRVLKDRGIEPHKLVWMDWDILWIGDVAATNFRRFAEEFYFTPYDLLFRCGFAGTRRYAKYHSLLQTGIIGASQFGVDELMRLWPELSKANMESNLKGGLYDQQAMVQVMHKISDDACILIRQLDDIVAHHRMYAGQSFIHIAGHTPEQKTAIASHVRKLHPL